MSAMHSTTSKTLALVTTLAALAMVTGCHKKASGVDPNSLGPAPAAAPAPTATITADPAAIDQGQSVVLNWRSQNASAVSIDGIGDVNLNGTQTVSPSNSTNFHLLAKGDGGTAEANVRVTVRVPVAPTAPPNASTSVTQAASYLAAHPAIKVIIGGYCDDRGSAEYNLALGENRANSARAALVSAGVSSNRLRVISYGKEKQFCTDETESCWQQNRRAQFSLDR